MAESKPASGADAPTTSSGSKATQRESNRIQVSATKKPIFYYVSLAKRLLRQHEEVELSALGGAASAVASVAEILRRSGWVDISAVSTGLEAARSRERAPESAARTDADAAADADAGEAAADAGDAAAAPRPPAARKPKLSVTVKRAEGYEVLAAAAAAAREEGGGGGGRGRRGGGGGQRGGGDAAAKGGSGSGGGGGAAVAADKKAGGEGGDAAAAEAEGK